MFRQLVNGYIIGYTKTVNTCLFSRYWLRGRTISTTVHKRQDYPDPRTAWPRQAHPKLESITPPHSTSIAETSTAPLLKDLFLGQLHLELLHYPELDNKAEVQRVNEIHDRLKHFMLQLDSRAIDRDGCLPENLLSELSQLGLFGMQADPTLGGLGLNTTQAARANEATGLDGSIAAMLHAHHAWAVRTLQLFGTDEQKRHFLPPLSSGEKIAAFGLTEPSSGTDLQAIKTRAVLSEDGQNYAVTGQKSWITNGTIADYLILLARVHDIDNKEECKNGKKITAFIVDRNSPGVHTSVRFDTVGLRGSNVGDVFLDNVQVPIQNQLGDLGQGIQIAKHVLSRGYLDLAAYWTGVIRYLLSYATEHCLQRHQFGQPLGNFQLVRSRLAKMTLNLYAMESATFFLARLLDAKPDRDLALEMAALKFFSSNSLWSAVNDCMQLAGRYGLDRQIPFERFFRDARSWLMFGGSNDALCVEIGIAGLLHIASQIEELSKKVRLSGVHPFTYAKAMYTISARKRGWGANKVGAGPKVTEGDASRVLRKHVHPNLSLTADRLATIVQRFQSLAETLTFHHGASITEQQVDLNRLAEVATDILLTAICLGRASRAISIGIPLHDYEITLANTFANCAFKRIESKYEDDSRTNRCCDRIASELLTQAHYPAVHPLSRVW